MTILHYLTAPYAQFLETRVAECTPVAEGHAVVLAETPLYPEGGGQPADRGWIDDVPVSDLTWDDQGRLVHRVAEPMSGRVTVRVDWPRRYDHMQQHTAQHLRRHPRGRHGRAAGGQADGHRDAARGHAPVLSDPAEAVAELAGRIMPAIEVRGGGEAGLHQGKARRLDRLPEALEALRAAIDILPPPA